MAASLNYNEKRVIQIASRIVTLDFGETTACSQSKIYDEITLDITKPRSVQPVFAKFDNSGYKLYITITQNGKKLQLSDFSSINLITQKYKRGVTCDGISLGRAVFTLNSVILDRKWNLCCVELFSDNMTVQTQNFQIYCDELINNKTSNDTAPTSIGNGIDIVSIDEKGYKNVVVYGDAALKMMPSRDSKTSSVKLVNVTEIDDWRFSGYAALESIEICNTVLKMGRGVFRECESLKKVDIPNSVVSIDPWCFYECSSLRSVNLPEKLGTIGEYMFYGCRDLAEISIPQGVTEIDDYAFFGCGSITSINIPNNVNNIGSSAFMACNNLANVQIGTNVKSLGNSAFKSCSSLTVVSLPKTLSTIGIDAFYGCTSLKKISLSNSLLSIPQHTFYSCNSLEGIVIPASVTSIGSGAFSKCTGLIYVTMSPNLTELDVAAFQDCSSLQDIAIPGGVSEICSGAFENCTSLTKVTLSEGIETISGAFSGCSSLKEITIPSTMHMISHSAFFNCSSLVKITINKCQSGTLVIQSTAFNNSNIKDVYFSGSIAEWVTLIDKSYPYYWKDANLYCNGQLITSITDLGTITSIDNYSFSGFNSIQSVSLPETVTSIGSSAFAYCKGLRSVSLSGISSVSGSILSGCTALLNATFGSENHPISLINSSAMSGCTQENLHIVIYANSSPLADQPWGATSAIIRYVLPTQP